MTIENREECVAFENLEEYPALKPSEVRSRLDGLTDLKRSMDDLRDELYEIGLSFSRKKLELELLQFEVTKSVYGFLTVDDEAKRTQVKESLDNLGKL